MGYTVGDEQLRDLTSVAQFVAEACNLGADASSRAFGVRTRRPACKRHRAIPRGLRACAPRIGGQHAAHAGQRAGRQASLIAKAKNLGIDLTLHADKRRTSRRHQAPRGGRLLLRDGRRLAALLLQ